MSSNTLFDQLNSILNTSNYWMSDDNKKEYSPLGINTGLSQHVDTIFYVNEMNQLWQHVSPRMHYDFYFYGIRKTKRVFRKWAKKVKDEDIELIMNYYQVSQLKAEDIYAILTKDQLNTIKEELYVRSIS